MKLVFLINGKITYLNIFKPLLFRTVIRKTVILMVSIIQISGQNLTIFDSYTFDPLKDVNVFVGNRGTTTDTTGSCDLSIFDEKDIVSFRLIGYENIKILKSQIPRQIFMENEIISIDIVNVFGKGKGAKRKYKRLERDVKKVYPYAIIISSILPKYDEILDSIYHLSRLQRYIGKRKIFTSIEDELISQYGYSVKKLTKNQGRILIKLIDRETQRTSYHIIRDFRSVIHAGFWQFTAKIFGHDLKTKYSLKNKEDKFIEYIIRRMNNDQDIFLKIDKNKY